MSSSENEMELRQKVPDKKEPTPEKIQVLPDNKDDGYGNSEETKTSESDEPRKDNDSSTDSSLTSVQGLTEFFLVRIEFFDTAYIRKLLIVQPQFSHNRQTCSITSNFNQPS